jgi:hypothetical protein
VITPKRVFRSGLTVFVTENLGDDNFIVFNLSSGRYFQVSGDEIEIEEVEE